MFRLNITKAMIYFIKDTREKYNVKASELATKINKSSAYLSKFDKGDYKTISYEELCFMLHQICGDENMGKKLVDDFLTDFIKTSENVAEKEEDVDYGLNTFDDVVRLIEIPSDLVDYINDKISKNKFEISDIVNKANENADLEDFTKNSKYEANVYYSYEKDDIKENSKKLADTFIKVTIQEANIIDILNKTITKTNYLTLKSLLYTIYRLQNIEESTSSYLARTFLDKFHFYNLKRFKIAELAEKSKTEAIKEMENMPSLFIRTISDFANITFTFFKKNPIYALSKINGFRENLYTDPAYTIALLDLPFYKLKDSDRDNKKKLMVEIDQLISKYSEKKPDDKFETY